MTDPTTELIHYILESLIWIWIPNTWLSQPKFKGTLGVSGGMLSPSYYYYYTLHSTSFTRNNYRCRSVNSTMSSTLRNRINGIFWLDVIHLHIRLLIPTCYGFTALVIKLQGWRCWKNSQKCNIFGCIGNAPEELLPCAMHYQKTPIEPMWVPDWHVMVWVSCRFWDICSQILF